MGFIGNFAHNYQCLKAAGRRAAGDDYMFSGSAVGSYASFCAALITYSMLHPMRTGTLLFRLGMFEER